MFAFHSICDHIPKKILNIYFHHILDAEILFHFRGEFKPPLRSSRHGLTLAETSLASLAAKLEALKASTVPRQWIMFAELVPLF